MRRAFKALTAMTAGVALLVLGAVPAAASQTGTVTGGSLDIDLAPSATGTMGSTGSGCASSLEVTVVTHLPNVMTDEYVDFLRIFVPITYGTGTYVMEIATNAQSIYMGGPSYEVVSLGYSLPGMTSHAAIYPSTGAGSCTPSSTASLCSGNIYLTFPTGMDGSFTGTIASPSWTQSGTLTLNGTATVSTFGCGAPFGFLHGSTMTITDLTIDF